MGEPFHGHFVSPHEHDVLFYEGHSNQACHKISVREKTPLTFKTQENLKEHITRIASPEFNLFHMASPDLERLIVGQSTATTGTTKSKETTTLNTSDLNVLNLVSPDFEKIFSTIQAGDDGTIRETIHEMQRGPNSVKGGKCVEKQHEIYTKTFVDALQKIHEQQIIHREQINKNKTGLNHCDRENDKRSSRTIFEHHPELFKLQAHVKMSENVREHMRSREIGTHELGINPSTFSLPPIDLQVQEIVKRERKKQKNRVAASKCRRKKLEREAQLEVTVQQLKKRNIELNAVANALRNQVTDLKQRVMEHIACGCHVTTLTMAY